MSGKTKHEKSFVDYDKPYEQNIVGLRGIIYFTAGLTLLVVVSFGLMWVLQNVLEDQEKQNDLRDQNPMALRGVEALPPEPRLQAAPGFGVGEGADRVNLELQAPQSEYWELQKRWTKLLAEGQKDPRTGTVVTLPIEEAKRRLLEQNPKAAPAEQGQRAMEESRAIVSFSSSGRVANEIRR